MKKIGFLVGLLFTGLLCEAQSWLPAIREAK